ncbi:unnamed protein product, partial [marine sediment metagenome]
PEGGHTEDMNIEFNTVPDDKLIGAILNNIGGFDVRKVSHGDKYILKMKQERGARNKAETAAKLIRQWDEYNTAKDTLSEDDKIVVDGYWDTQARFASKLAQERPSEISKAIGTTLDSAESFLNWMSTAGKSAKWLYNKILAMIQEGYVDSLYYLDKAITANPAVAEVLRTYEVSDLIAGALSGRYMFSQKDGYVTLTEPQTSREFVVPGPFVSRVLDTIRFIAREELDREKAFQKVKESLDMDPTDTDKLAAMEIIFNVRWSSLSKEYLKG